MINGACYVRVSTDNQLENYSIEEQIDRLNSFCKARDIHIVKFYTDGGYSGGSMDRPALQQMLADIDAGLIDAVIVYKLDRLSRSQKDTLTLIEDRFLANHVDFISVNENFDTLSPFGRAMIGMLSVFAQLEKDQITERFTMGRIGRAKKGYFHGGGNAPTGYDYIDGNLIVNEYEALQVQDLYQYYLKGHTIHDCWRYMQQNYTTKYGGWNSETVVRNVLKNEVYTGKIKFKGMTYPGKHTPLISEETFAQVQYLLKGSSRAAKAHTRSPFQAGTLLSGLLYCGKCGARFHGEHGNYSCYSRTKGDKKYVLDPDCRNKKWKIEELDSLVIDYISRLSFSELTTQPARPEKTDHSARLAEIRRQTEKLIDLYQIGTISLETVSGKIGQLSREQKFLEADAQKQQFEKAAPDETASARDIFLSLLQTGCLAEKRACLFTLIERITIEDDNVTIQLRLL